MTPDWKFVKENLHTFIMLNVNLVVAFVIPHFPFYVDLYIPYPPAQFSVFQIVNLITAYLLLIYLFLAFFPQLRKINFTLDILLIVIQITLIVFIILTPSITISLGYYTDYIKMPYILGVAILTIVDRSFEIAGFFITRRKKIVVNDKYYSGFEPNAEK